VDGVDPGLAGNERRRKTKSFIIKWKARQPFSAIFFSIFWKKHLGGGKINVTAQFKVLIVNLKIVWHSTGT
jgi:hypothetical protein